MADTPESLVYRGREGTGAAQIFGREGNPMRALLARKADIEQKEAIKAAQAKLEKEKRDKKMWEMINVDPEKAFQPFNQQVIDAADKHRARIVSYFEAGGNPEDPNFQRMAKKGWNEVNDMATRSNYIKSTLDDTLKTIKENPYLKSEYYFPKIWDTYMDERGNGKPLDQVDPIAIQNIYVDDPLGFDANKYTKDFTANMKDNVFNFIKQKNVNNGILTEDIETKIKGELYTIDANGDPVKDEKGNPIINLTPDFVNSFTDNENAKRYLEAVAQQEGTDVNNVIEQFVRPQTGVQKNIRPSFSREPIGYFDRFNKEQKRAEAVTDRYRKVYAAINAVNPDGSISPDAQAVLGALKNAKSLDGNVMDAQIIPGTNTPGMINFGGTKIPASPSNRIVFSVKTSDRGLPKIQEINLDSPDSFEAINGMLNNSPSETDKFSTNEITQITGKRLEDLYGTTRNTSASKEFMAQQENMTIKNIMESPVEEDIAVLRDRTYQGRKITGARKVITEKAHSLFGIPFGKWGEKDAIEIETIDANGNKDYKNITDPEEIRKILKGDNMVKVFDPNGNPGQIPADKLEAALKAGYKRR